MRLKGAFHQDLQLALRSWSPPRTQENLEVAVKVLDGCWINSRYWVFAAGLTNVEVDLTVTDTWTGFEWTSRNPSGAPFQPVIDVEALPVCP